MVAVVNSQVIVNGTALTLVERQVVPAAALTLTLATGVGSLAGHSFSIVGLDANGYPQTVVQSALALGANTTTETWRVIDSITPTGAFTGYTVATSYVGAGPVNYNCDCSETTGFETLSQLRVRVLRRLGYSAQAASPPPGMAALVDDFLISAQRFLYTKYKGLRTERIFSWVMTPDIRFYDFADNVEVCTKRWNGLTISSVHIEDLNGAWLRLSRGINPGFYTSVMFPSLPERYDVRQCVEVFPPPDAAYTLRIKGRFGLEQFSADGHPTTIDSELVFLWALANAKAHYKQPDASNIAAQANTYLGNLVADGHQTARYVPGVVELAPAVRPHFLPLDS